MKLVLILCLVVVLPLSAFSQRHLMDNEELGLQTSVIFGSHDNAGSVGFRSGIAISPYIDIGYTRLVSNPRQLSDNDYLISNSFSGRLNVLRQDAKLPFSLSLSYQLENKSFKFEDTAGIFHHYNIELSSKHATLSFFELVGQISYGRNYISSNSDIRFAETDSDFIPVISFGTSLLFSINRYGKFVLSPVAQLSEEYSSFIITAGFLFTSRNEFNP